jgi:UDP-N-acetylglucosamine--N-acetylmuramyl-(pentapeptide) pyrophosphoryl-undecaprenol N-acetylglucosamine transferase
MSDLRVAIAGGGTGGHISPALAVAEEVSDRNGADVLLFGSACGLEATLDNGCEFETVLLDTPRSGGGMMRLPVAGAKLLAAVGKAVATLKRFRPQVVVGTGGYASVAPGVAARMLGIPLLLLEQNVIPGRANRLLARIAREVHTQFSESVPYFPYGSHVIVTGNPVRRYIHGAAMRRRHRRTDAPFTLLVMGGSLGAHSINVALGQALPRLKEAMSDMRVLHCAGTRDETDARARLSASGLAGQVWGFHDSMWELYAESDIAVCRAGATSMA